MVTCSHAADLGLQAAQRVVSSGPEQALRVLRDLAQNLPVQARWVWSYCNGCGQTGIVCGVTMDGCINMLASYALCAHTSTHIL